MNSSWPKVVNAVYMLSSTYSPDQKVTKESFMCLFECLRDLLPDLWYRQALATFMQQEPIDRYLNYKDTLFEWVYKLNNYISLLKRRQGQLVTDNMTLEQTREQYQFITKNDWGNFIWFLIHFIAANLQGPLHKNHSIAFRAFIVCLSHILPCVECRHHMSEYLKTSNIDPYLSKVDGAYLWTWEFHNEVNIRLGKPIMEMRQSQGLYLLATTKNRMYDNDNYTVISDVFA